MKRAPAVLAVLAVVWVSTSAAPAARQGCEQRGRTVRENSQIRVYEFEFPHNPDATFFAACDKATGRRYRLGGESDTYVIISIRDTIRVAGRAVYFGYVEGGDEEPLGTFANVAEVRFPLPPGAGREVGDALGDMTIGAVPGMPPPQEREVVRKLVATRTAVAWATCNGSQDDDPIFGCARESFSRIIVRTTRDFGRPGLSEQVAVGRGIDPRSLRLSHNRTRVVWTDNGRKRSAKLPT